MLRTFSHRYLNEKLVHKFDVKALHNVTILWQRHGMTFLWFNDLFKNQQMGINHLTSYYLIQSESHYQFFIFFTEYWGREL